MKTSLLSTTALARYIRRSCSSSWTRSRWYDYTRRLWRSWRTPAVFVNQISGIYISDLPKNGRYDWFPPNMLIRISVRQIRPICVKNMWRKNECVFLGKVPVVICLFVFTIWIFSFPFFKHRSLNCSVGSSVCSSAPHLAQPNFAGVPLVQRYRKRVSSALRARRRFAPHVMSRAVIFSAWSIKRLDIFAGSLISFAQNCSGTSFVLSHLPPSCISSVLMLQLASHQIPLIETWENLRECQQAKPHLSRPEGLLVQPCWSHIFIS